MHCLDSRQLAILQVLCERALGGGARLSRRGGGGSGDCGYIGYNFACL